MPVFAPSVSCSIRAPSRWAGSFIAALALAALAGCADTAKESANSIAWSEPGTPAATGTVSPGAPATAAPATSAPATSAPAPGGPPLDWRTGLQGDTIVVELFDRGDFYRVDRVELVGPNALTAAAYEINRSTNRESGSRYGGGYGGGPNVGVGVGSWSGGRRSATGVGLGLDFPLGGSSSRGTATAPGTLTAARIRIPDMGLYRETSANWVVRVTLTNGAQQQSSAVFPAPKPAG